MKIKRVLLWFSSFVILAVILLFAALRSFDRPLPEAYADPRADQLARRMMAAIDDQAWQRTVAVAWSFRGEHDHLWDRRRQFARVRWDDVEVLLDLDSRLGVARRGGEEVAGDRLEPMLEQAWSIWCNDSFWLNPISKLFDDGTRRALVDLPDGDTGVLVTYESGGVTPGDSYLWIVGTDGLPVAWRMWTQILPVGGVETSWQDWITLSTGARISTRHQTRLGDLVIGDVRGAASLAELEAEDPFAELEAEMANNRLPEMP